MEQVIENKETDWLNSNNNSKNTTRVENYEHFNNFIFSDDVKILGKLLHRFLHYRNIQHLPGDIVEIGVFRGSGMATFLKFNEIFSNTSNKKVIGFDIYDAVKSEEILQKDAESDRQGMSHIFNRVPPESLSYESVRQNLIGTSISTDKFDMIAGDVEETLPKFLEENPGFRISLLYIDVDIERPTYNALKYLWDRILPGGVVIFDEYEFHKYSESCGAEKFFKERDIVPHIISTGFPSPSAYIYKKDWK